MLTTICFYIFIGIIGLFGLALTIASIASFVHNFRRNSRVKKYINEEQKKQPEKQYIKTQTKHYNQDRHTTNSPPQDNNGARVIIGYLPCRQTSHTNQTVQANNENNADKQKKQALNHKNVLFKNPHNNNATRYGGCVPKYKIKNYNEYSKFSRHNHRYISRAES